MALRGSLAYKERDHTEPDAVNGFQGTMMALLNKDRPSRMPFFRRLAQLPRRSPATPSFSAKFT